MKKEEPSKLYIAEKAHTHTYIYIYIYIKG